MLPATHSFHNALAILENKVRSVKAHGRWPRQDSGVRSDALDKKLETSIIQANTLDATWPEAQAQDSE
jgi:hypothetical protein